MEKIASFTIDHIKLEPGVYVSRKDTVGAEVITTFDLRMTSPNDEPVMNTAEMHTIEHLAATFLRNHASSSSVAASSDAAASVEGAASFPVVVLSAASCLSPQPAVIVAVIAATSNNEIAFFFI